MKALFAKKNPKGSEQPKGQQQTSPQEGPSSEISSVYDSSYNQYLTKIETDYGVQSFETMGPSANRSLEEGANDKSPPPPQQAVHAISYITHGASAYGMGCDDDDDLSTLGDESIIRKVRQNSQLQAKLLHTYKGDLFQTKTGSTLDLEASSFSPTNRSNDLSYTFHKIMDMNESIPASSKLGYEIDEESRKKKEMEDSVQNMVIGGDDSERSLDKETSCCLKNKWMIIRFMICLGLFLLIAAATVLVVAILQVSDSSDVSYEEAQKDYGLPSMRIPVAPSLAPGFPDTYAPPPDFDERIPIVVVTQSPTFAPTAVTEEPTDVVLEVFNRFDENASSNAIDLVESNTSFEDQLESFFETTRDESDNASSAESTVHPNTNPPVSNTNSTIETSNADEGLSNVTLVDDALVNATLVDDTINMVNKTNITDSFENTTLVDDAVIDATFVDDAATMVNETNSTDSFENATLVGDAVIDATLVDDAATIVNETNVTDSFENATLEDDATNTTSVLFENNTLVNDAQVVSSRVEDTPEESQIRKDLELVIGSVSPDSLFYLEDPSSSHSRAFEWMIGDPNYWSYEIPTIVQRWTLAVLYYSTGGPNWKTENFPKVYAEGKSPWLSYSDECLWESSNEGYKGRICDQDTKMYFAIHLRSVGLTGSLPTELGLLSSHMRLLFANDNRLAGTLPTELGALSLLEKVNFQYNELTGSLPTEIGSWSALKIASLGNNFFDGSIPSTLGEWASVHTIGIENNRLTGRLPAELSRMPNIRKMAIEKNYLTGPIPDAWKDMHQLTSLSIQTNSLTGKIPKNLCPMEILKADCAEVECKCCTECFVDPGPFVPP